MRAMNRNFPRIQIRRVSRRNSKKHRHQKKTQSNPGNPCLSSTIVSSSFVQSNRSRTLINSKKRRTNDQGHEDSISTTQANKEIKHSPTYFHLPLTDRSFNRTHRITPVHCQDLFQNDWRWDENHR